MWEDWERWEEAAVVGEAELGRGQGAQMWEKDVSRLGVDWFNVGM